MNDDNDIKIWRDELSAAIALYTESYDVHGDRLEALRWGSEKSQQKRFEVFCQIGELKNASVIDLGSGLADLLAYLNGTGFAGKYHGIDPVQSFVRYGEQRFPEQSFNVGSVFDIEQFDPADFLFSSGIFTYVKHKPIGYLRFVMERMLARANRGIAVNALSTWGSEPLPNEQQFDPGEVMTALQNIAPRITLRHDYMPHDFTVYAWVNK